jgi:formylglycine-generating enzyme required for sulfatase activity
MDIHEVTVAAYRRCVKKGECLRASRTSHWPRGRARKKAWKHSLEAYGELCNDAIEGNEDHPINCVTWAQADQYCRFSGKQLPTGEQWALAAGGAEAQRFPWGDDEPSLRHGNFCGPECRSWKFHNRLTGRTVMYAKADEHHGTAPVGSYPDAASPFGVLDMAGNVFEWTADLTVEGDSEPAAFIRGGSFGTVHAAGAEVSAQVSEARTTHSPAIGFRCVTTLD